MMLNLSTWSHFPDLGSIIGEASSYNQYVFLVKVSCRDQFIPIQFEQFSHWSRSDTIVHDYCATLYCTRTELNFECNKPVPSPS